LCASSRFRFQISLSTRLHPLLCLSNVEHTFLRVSSPSIPHVPHSEPVRVQPALALIGGVRFFNEVSLVLILPAFKYGAGAMLFA